MLSWFLTAIRWAWLAAPSAHAGPACDIARSEQGGARALVLRLDGTDVDLQITFPQKGTLRLSNEDPSTLELHMTHALTGLGDVRVTGTATVDFLAIRGDPVQIGPWRLLPGATVVVRPGRDETLDVSPAWADRFEDAAKVSTAVPCSALSLARSHEGNWINRADGERRGALELRAAPSINAPLLVSAASSDIPRSVSETPDLGEPRPFAVFVTGPSKEGWVPAVWVRGQAQLRGYVRDDASVPIPAEDTGGVVGGTPTGPRTATMVCERPSTLQLVKDGTVHEIGVIEGGEPIPTTLQQWRRRVSKKVVAVDLGAKPLDGAFFQVMAAARTCVYR